MSLTDQFPWLRGLDLFDEKPLLATGYAFSQLPAEQRARGAVDAALTMGSGMAGEAASGLLGLYEGAQSALQGGDFLPAATGAIERSRAAFPYYTPRSALGSPLLQAAGSIDEAVYGPFESGAGRLADRGFPALATGALLVPEVIDALTPGRRLPMDEAARMQRAADLGFPEETLYHGSTHNIERFSDERLNPESHFGKGYYLTTDPYDASVNYAGMGPDLTGRVDMTAERLADDILYNPDKWDLPARADGTADAPMEVIERMAQGLARDKLVGENRGVVYPVVARQDNIFDTRPGGDTWVEARMREFDPEDYMDEAKLDTYREDFDTDADYTEALQERAQELAIDDSYNFEPEGPLMDFMESVRRQAGSEADPIIDALQDYLYEEGIGADRLNEIMRKTEWYPEDDMGNLVGSEIYRQALQDAGYTGVRMDASAAFPGMDMNPGTEHLIMFNPEDIRSINAAFDPERRMSPNILAGGMGAALGLGLLAEQDDEPVVPYRRGALSM